MTSTPLQNILPRSPSPRSALPNAGPRSDVTHFIPASGPSSPLESTSTSASASAPASVSAAPVDLLDQSPSPTSHHSGRRLSWAPGTWPAAPSGRRAIAHSPKVLGQDWDAVEQHALSDLQNGQVDVSFTPAEPGSPRAKRSGSGSNSNRNSIVKGKGKGKARAHVESDLNQPFDAGDQADFPDFDETASLADVDLEQGLASPARAQARARARARASQDAYRAAHDASASRVNLLSGIGLGLGTRNDEDDQADDGKRGGYFYEFGGESRLGVAPEGFERITVSESSWMWVSVVLVTVICLVATLISTDVIDWPGDGIGEQ